MITQEIRYTTTADDVRIAWASSGNGAPVVKTANWLNHLEHDWESPVWRHFMRELSTDFRLIRYDQRGNGLSDWDVDEFSFEHFVADLEAVVDAAGVDRFTLLGISQGCAHSVEYAVRHPERVERLILHGGYAAGHTYWSEEHRQRRASLAEMAKQGWGKNNPAFLQVFSAMFFPDGGHDTHDAWNELQRVATPLENAVQITAANAATDVRDKLGDVRVPTLVTHCRGEMAVPFENGKELAAGIPDARFVALESRNHLLVEHEPAWSRWLREVHEFAGIEPREPSQEVLASARTSDQTPAPPAAAPRHGGLEEGDELLHYRIDGHVASGGMGAVYRATDTNLRRTVAIKVLPTDLAGDAEYMARFQREARMLAALNHPNIAAIYGLENLDSGKFIVMEFADGGTLGERLKEGPLPLEEALAICRSVATGLAVAHDKDIVHRDLKPSNIMLTGSGVKLLDFGIAKTLPSDQLTIGDRVPDSDDLTRSGVLMGTGPYMSPEQVRGQEVGKASDVWSFGCVLYQTLRGRSPFRRETLADTITAVVHHDPDLAALPANTPKRVIKLIDQCLQKDEAQRLADIEAAGAVLDEVAARKDGGRGILGWFTGN